MIQSGTRPTRLDHRDYDFHKSFGTVMGTTDLPESYTTDPGLWMPSQEAENCLFTPCVPPLPFGCTDYTTAGLCSDEDGLLYNPMQIETVTHANANRGGDVRTALDAAKTIFKRTAYFNIRASGAIDMFDAVRLAMYSAQPEKRSVSVGTPWYQEFERPINGILYFPLDFNNIGSWHNHSIVGWKTIDGIPYLISKSWQGAAYGDGGYCYFSRALFNATMAVQGSVAFTITKNTPATIERIDLGIVDTIVSFIRNLFHV